MVSTGRMYPEGPTGCGGRARYVKGATVRVMRAPAGARYGVARGVPPHSYATRRHSPPPTGARQGENRTRGARNMRAHPHRYVAGRLCATRAASTPAIHPPFTLTLPIRGTETPRLLNLCIEILLVASERSFKNNVL